MPFSVDEEYAKENNRDLVKNLDDKADKKRLPWKEKKEEGKDLSDTKPGEESI